MMQLPIIIMADKLLYIFELLSMARGFYATRMCHILNMRCKYNAYVYAYVYVLSMQFKEQP